MIVRATKEDVGVLAELALLMWPEQSRAALEAEFTDMMTKKTVVFFLVLADKHPIGFAQCQLRYDYVEGTDSSPVGYLEGIFIQKAYRRQGYAKALLKECEGWALAQGCTEFASDCELINTDSQIFHQKMGFLEANRIVCYTKKLEQKMEYESKA